MLVSTPRTTVSASAASSRSSASAAWSPVRDDLREHRVVVGRDDRTRRRCRCRRGCRRPPASSYATIVPVDGRNPVRRVLGVHARLDGVAGRGARRPAARSAAPPRRSAPATRRGRRRRPDDTTASVTGCSTCRRVFISMKKNSSGRVGGHEELHGAGADVANGARHLARGLADAGAGRGIQQGGGRLLDDLLVAALQRALALAEVDDVAGAHRRAPAPRCGAVAR